MPKIDFKPITRPIDFGEYAPEYGGAVVHMWVNMPRGLLADWYTLMREAAGYLNEVQRAPGTLDERWQSIEQRMMVWLSVAWSQHPDTSTHWTADDVKALSDHLVSIDPQAWYWLTKRVQDLIRDYRTAERKN